MRVYVLGSGSSGNAALLEVGGTRILIDAGIGPRAAAGRLQMLGGPELLPRGVDAIVVTHQHGDHISRIESLARALKAPIYFHRGIEARRVRARFEVRNYVARETFRIGAVEIRAVPVPHDAPQVGLRFSGAGSSFGLATDLGRVPSELVALLAGCDVALVEANHCSEMLAGGPYPEKLKRRVGGDFGHLANHQTAELAARLSGTRVHRLLLGHLSRSNNTPERALAAVKARCRGLDVAVIEHGVPYAFSVRSMRPTQLMLPLDIAR